jgi:hypothetical protein
LIIAKPFYSFLQIEQGYYPFYKEEPGFVWATNRRSTALDALEIPESPLRGVIGLFKNKTVIVHNSVESVPLYLMWLFKSENGNT